MALRRLQFCCFVLFACLLAAPALDACSCAYRGPVCKWFPSSTEPAFVGRVVEMEPGSDREFRNRIETALRPYVGDAGFVDPRRLEGVALSLYVNIYRDFWKSIIRPEALETLSDVSNFGEFLHWQRQSGFYEGRRRVRFAVTEVFAGDVGETVDIYTSIWYSCSAFFLPGEDYLVFASGGPDKWTTSACSGTREASSAQEDLEYLRAYASAGTLGSFVGTAYARSWNSEGYPESSAVVGAAIEVSGENGSWKARTGQNGRFSVVGLQPGRYFVSGQHQERPLSLGPAGLPETESIQTVPARGCAVVHFTRPPPSGSITGRIFGPTTEALGGISVTAVPTNGRSSGRQSQTDQNGRFEIKELQPGGYFVGVNIDGPPSAHRPYATLYYPGVPAKDSAGVLQVSDGVATNAGTLVLGRRMRVRKILGKVVGDDDQPIAEVQLRLVPEDAPYGISSYRTSADGSFELEGLEETSYTIRAEIQNPRDGSMVTAEAAVPITGDASITIVLVVP
ncbi:MAG: hypothetical protein O3A53_12245 [Acidobacteria bacterium]|nr:hypothetical protein [Acidobacteriota bacterium]